jgi:Beta-lactamase enzyme family
VVSLSLPFVLAALSVVSTGEVASGANSGVRMQTTEPSKVSVVATKQGAVIPETVAGRRLSDVLLIARAGSISPGRFAELFSSTFKSHVSATQLVDIFAAALGPSVRVLEVLVSTPNTISVVAEGVGGRVKIDLATNSADAIEGLLLTPYIPAPKAARNWPEIDKRMATVAPSTAMVAATVGIDGKCVVRHGLRERKAGPLGSMFKLYVLAAVANAVEQRKLSWDTSVKIRDEWKSLPSGTMHNEPTGTVHTVAKMADAMISVSDNTATDHLIRTVGRGSVERTMTAAGMSDTSRNVPFLTTRELFVLKGVKYPALASKYKSLGVSAKRALLDREIASENLAGFQLWSKPLDVESIEWFASPLDVCRVFGYLGSNNGSSSGAAVNRALSINDGGLKLDAKLWPTVWFKGGSEPGVLTLGFFARGASGQGVVVVTMMSDTTQVLDEQAAVLELLELTRNAFTLLQ